MAVAPAPKVAQSRDNAGQVGNALRNLLINFNALVADFYAAVIVPLTGDAILTPTVMATGSTTTNLATTAFSFTNIGATIAAAAVAVGTALGALGTVPFNPWAVIAVDIVAGSTISFVSGAANYTTGYATEALARAAVPAKTPSKARVGYFTVLTKVGSPWVAGTDSLVGGAVGNPASQTKFYPTPSVAVLTAQKVGDLSSPAVPFTT